MPSIEVQTPEGLALLHRTQLESPVSVAHGHADRPCVEELFVNAPRRKPRTHRFVLLRGPDAGGNHVPGSDHTRAV